MPKSELVIIIILNYLFPKLGVWGNFKFMLLRVTWFCFSKELLIKYMIFLSFNKNSCKFVISCHGWFDILLYKSLINLIICYYIKTNWIIRYVDSFFAVTR